MYHAVLSPNETGNLSHYPWLKSFVPTVKTSPGKFFDQGRKPDLGITAKRKVSLVKVIHGFSRITGRRVGATDYRNDPWVRRFYDRQSFDGRVEIVSEDLDTTDIRLLFPHIISEILDSKTMIPP